MSHKGNDMVSGTIYIILSLLYQDNDMVVHKYLIVNSKMKYILLKAQRQYITSLHTDRFSLVS